MRRNICGRPVMTAVLLMLLLLFMPTAQAHAASAGIEFTTDPETVRVGDVVTVTMTVTADIAPGDIEGYISYNDGILEYVTGPECVAGGEGILKISDPDPLTDMNVRKYAMYFKAVSIGSCEFRVRGVPEVYESDSGYLMSVSSSSKSIEVLAAAKASSDATLAALKISPGTLEPAFSASVYEYRTRVSNETVSLLVSAGTNDDSATVRIEGASELRVGDNKVLVLVTAEDGSVGRYTVNVYREAGEGDQPDDGAQSVGDSSQAGDGNNEGDRAAGTVYFYVTDENGSAVLNAGSRYTICDDVSGVAIPEGYSKTSVLISGHTVTAYYPTADVSSDILLLVLAREGGEPELYSFDRVEKTIQRYSVKKGETIGNKTGSGYSTLDEQELVAGYEKSLSNLTMVIAVLCGVSMLLLILTIRMAVKVRDSARRRSSGQRKTNVRRRQ